jgi:hypothetical protein
MSQNLTPETLREQARRVRAHARHLTGDLGADRLLELASELEAQANSMELTNEPGRMPRVAPDSPEISRSQTVPPPLDHQTAPEE